MHCCLGISGFDYILQSGYGGILKPLLAVASAAWSPRRSTSTLSMMIVLYSHSCLGMVNQIKESKKRDGSW
ncbi:hypothetical protein CMV_027881 [Castanea mollissima]|uniref:Uncharacterized protein n=1 Tax=Castanea mollissima TaxID=60419 RepID=A0A8J4V5X2_9ROSI|nr:hypothetical protein CMV_027881 [Castanea mollissima]